MRCWPTPRSVSVIWGQAKWNAATVEGDRTRCRAVELVFHTDAFMVVGPTRSSSRDAG